jgi:hypothetical protein
MELTLEEFFKFLHEMGMFYINILYILFILILCIEKVKANLDMF